jgi:hypothetical protein
MIKRISVFLLGACATVAAAAQGLSASELLLEIQNCTLTLSGERPPMDADADAMVLKVGKADIGGGVTSHLFYFAPAKDGGLDDFGLLLDAPLGVVRQALPALAKPAKLNGYHRGISSIGDPDGSSNGEGKTLLACKAHPPS